MNKMNYQKELEKVLDGLTDNNKRLLLHSCCAPCSSYCLEYLAKYFPITVFYYNPNISFEEEYVKRVAEQKRLIQAYNDEGKGFPISIIEGDYEPEAFYACAKGLEKVKEGGERCFKCYELRLRKAAELAAREGFDYFATTLTISPLKNAEKINEIGFRLEQEMKEASGENNAKTPLWLPSDFKKKEGYKRSIELSKEYGLYRQNFCGCAFSRAEAEETAARRCEE